MTIRLAVVDDPALAAAVARVKGEWNAETGSNFEVVETTEKELLRADRLPADGVLCPAHLLGVLAERKLLAPVPRKVLHSTEWAGVFSLLKLREAVWGDQAMAVPFGSPVFCCYYRADLLEKLGRRPPKTWEEYQSLAKLLAAKKPNGVALVRHDRAARSRLGGPGPAGPCRRLRQAPRQFLGAVRHRNDGAADLRPAVCAGAGRVGRRRQARARPIRCTTTPPRFAPHFGAANAAWP